MFGAAFGVQTRFKLQATPLISFHALKSNHVLVKDNIELVDVMKRKIPNANNTREMCPISALFVTSQGRN